MNRSLTDYFLFLLQLLVLSKILWFGLCIIFWSHLSFGRLLLLLVRFVLIDCLWCCSCNLLLIIFIRKLYTLDELILTRFNSMFYLRVSGFYEGSEISLSGWQFKLVVLWSSRLVRYKCWVARVRDQCCGKKEFIS